MQFNELFGDNMIYFLIDTKIKHSSRLYYQWVTKENNIQVKLYYQRVTKKNNIQVDCIIEWYDFKC